jgi:hypothetical protein
VFQFLATLSADSIILMKDKGEHVGAAFSGTLRHKLTTVPTGSFVVSPLTTLLASGWSEENVLAVLKEAGIEGLTAADLYRDPMENLATMESAAATDQALAIIRASLAIQGFLEITAGHMQQTGIMITYAKFQQGIFTLENGTKLSAQDLVTRMVTMQKEGLNSNLVAAVNAQLAMAQAMAPCKIPAVTADVFAFGAVVLNRLVIPRVIADLTYAPDMTILNGYAQHLGRAFYFQLKADDTCLAMGWNMGMIPKPVVGINTLAIPDEYLGSAPSYAVSNLPSPMTPMLTCTK